MEFVGRNCDLAHLDQHLAKPDGSRCIVHGRHPPTTVTDYDKKLDAADSKAVGIGAGFKQKAP